MSEFDGGHGSPTSAEAMRETVREALRTTSRIGPYFATTVTHRTRRGDVSRPGAADLDSDMAPGGSTIGLTELYRDGAPLSAAIADLARRLGTPERRVAASTLLLGHAARLWSVVLGCWATSAVVPDLSPGSVRVRTIPGSGVELIVADPSGRPVPRQDTDLAVRTIRATVLDGHLRPFVQAVHDNSGTAAGLLWGNAASALVGAVRVLGPAASPAPAAHPAPVPSDVMAAVRRVAARLLATPLLEGTTRHDRDQDGQLIPDSVVRRSCCLFYRVGGGLCGDCPFSASPTIIRRARRR